MDGIEQRLDAKTVAGREHHTVGFVPDHESKLAAQPVQALGSKILIEMKRDFAVAPGPQAMTGPFQFLLDCFVPIELAVADDRRPLILACDRLIARREIDDAEARMAQPDSAVRA
jgi:hypothetical protein